MKKNLKLVHLANFNSVNVGNGALVTGLEKLISEDFNSDIQWVREAWDDYTFGFKFFDEKFVEFINQHDGLIINGAVAIHGREYLKETGMRFELPLQLVKEVKRPVVFYGISYRHFQGQIFYHAETLRKTFRGLSGLDNVFLGVRNDGTKTWLEKTLRLDQSTLRNIYEIPDTGVFTKARSDEYPEILSDRKVIIFAPNDEDRIWRYGNDNVHHVRENGYELIDDIGRIQKDNSWKENRHKLINTIKTSLTKLIKDTGSQLLMVPHYIHDLSFITDLVDMLSPNLAHQCSISTGLTRVQGTERFYGRYLRADLAVSMRVHSMSPCIGLGVPMIPIITQPRMWDFLEATGLDDLGIDAFGNDLEEHLYESAVEILKDPEERIVKFDKASSEMRENVRQINQKIEKIFSQMN